MIKRENQKNVSLLSQKKTEKKKKNRPIQKNEKIEIKKKHKTEIKKVFQKKGKTNHWSQKKQIEKHKTWLSLLLLPFKKSFPFFLRRLLFSI